MNFTINVNNTLLETCEGETLLTALRNKGIKIPTLCHMSGFTPSGACRLCVVEIEGKRDLITSCTYPVEKGMVVKTNSPRVIKARKAIVEMLLANHPDDCLYCERNGNCELQWLAEEMHVKERKFFSKKNSDQRDHSSPGVYRDPAKCILCNRCVRVCEEVQLVTAIEFNYRGSKTKVNSAFNKGLNVSSCINCGQCIMVCPTGALVDISHIEKVQSAIYNPAKQSIAMISGGFVASVTEHFSLKVTDNPLGLITAALKKMGFDKVYDMSAANDLNIIYEAELLMQRVEEKHKTPLLSSCCPSWIEYAEEFIPLIIPDISPVKSPQQLMGRLIKYHLNPEVDIFSLFTVSFMTCVANKSEASRELNTQKGISETDSVITVREFLRMLRSYGLSLGRLEAVDPQTPFSQNSPAGLQMGYIGGKAEAIAMQINHIVNGKVPGNFKFSPPKNPGSRKEVKVKIGKTEYGFAWVSTIAEAQKYLDYLKSEDRTDIHYVEVMACPGGCVGGGGQPTFKHTEKQKLRKKVLQDIEKTREIAIAGQNEDLKTIIKKIKSGEAGSDFFTEFHKRDVIK
jgi:iron-only hydrogenase group A